MLHKPTPKHPTASSICKASNNSAPSACRISNHRPSHESINFSPLVSRAPSLSCKEPTLPLPGRKLNPSSKTQEMISRLLYPTTCSRSLNSKSSPSETTFPSVCMLPGCISSLCPAPPARKEAAKQSRPYPYARGPFQPPKQRSSRRQTRFRSQTCVSAAHSPAGRRRSHRLFWR